MSNELFIRDIGNLRQLGEDRMEPIGQDALTTSKMLAGLKMEQKAFGEFDNSDDLCKAYEQLRTMLAENTKITGQNLEKSGEAIVKIANHYADLEKKMS